MLDTFDTITNWATVAQTANITLNTTTFTQGTGALEVDKNGTGAAEGSILKKLQAPIDLESIRSNVLNTPTVKLRTYHANYTNVAHVAVRFVYRLTTAGVPDVYDDFRILKASLSNSTWNTLSVALGSPTSSTGSPTAEHRSKLIGLGLVITMDAAGNTITDVLFDALEIVGASGTAPLGVLIFDAERVLLPPLDTWNRLMTQQAQVNTAPQAMETLFLERQQGIHFGLQQVRAVHRALSQIHTLEESLRRFTQYAAANQGWGIAYPAGELINTTCSGSAGGMSITVASNVDFAFLGLTGTQEAGYADIRIGPNSSRQTEWARAIGYSSTTVYLDRPLRFTHASGTAVRSAGYYPSLGLLDASPPIQESGSAVRFECMARETA